MKSQMSQDERLELADKVIWNSTDVKNLQKEVDKVRLIRVQ